MNVFHVSKYPYFDAKHANRHKIKKLLIFGGAWELKMGVVVFRPRPHGIELGTCFDHCD